MIKKRLVVKCRSNESCLELLNKITENVSSRFLKSEIKGNTLQLEVIGLPYELKEIKYDIEMLKKEIESKHIKGNKYIKLHELGKLFHGTISIEVLSTVLKSRGYYVEVDDDKLYTNAPMDIIEEIVKKSKEIQEDEVVKYKLSSAAKRVVITLSLITDTPPNEVIELLKSQGFLEQGSFRYQLKENANAVINKLMKLFKSPK
ncbi:hypothetical protein EYM_03400 [Ignicoccus islandicus DSM 13165]|uniref:DUF2067 domain-containing protein n=1 Tax=Ignicoccus islandicus DSM 13165 TaxID=940295 RepID=A0A0U3EDA1_9CREN|nr:DUF2067 family protein [Ignicoccus islandicus]ALU12403.1 hypothetical protein EYM_03400 [Ignicoccus islandicus DSM 13165]